MPSSARPQSTIPACTTAPSRSSRADASHPKTDADTDQYAHEARGSRPSQASQSQPHAHLPCSYSDEFATARSTDAIPAKTDSNSTSDLARSSKSDCPESFAVLYSTPSANPGRQTKPRRPRSCPEALESTRAPKSD